MATATSCSAADLMLVAQARKARVKAAAERRVMLARIPSSGVFELLDAGPWTRALGYTHEELGGKRLCDLMDVDGPAAREVIAALLDESADQPLEVTLRCKGGGRKSFTFHRRFDAYAIAIFVLADERASATEQTSPLASPTIADGHGDERSARPDAGPARALLEQP